MSKDKTDKADNKSSKKGESNEKRLYNINEHIATVKLCDRQTFLKVEHNPRLLRSFLDILVMIDDREGGQFAVLMFNMDNDKWERHYCRTFEEIVEKYSYDKEIC